MSKHATIHDIANELNISVSTVSRALNNHPKISDETKRLVRESAEKLNYQVNSIASGLRRGKSNTIGIIVPRINRNFFSNVIAGIESKANELGYNVIIIQTDEKYQKEMAAIDALLKVPVEGIAISLSIETTNTDHIRKAIKRKVPLVFFDRVDMSIQCSKVIVDCYRGAFDATEHLIRQGCKNIVHFAGTDNVATYRERKEGYREAMRKYGLEVGDSMIIPNCLTQEKGYEAAQQLFGQANRPDGVVASSDYSALGCILYLKENGIKVAQDVAVVGFANEPFTSILEPSLSSVNQFSAKIGMETANLLFANMEDKHNPLNQEVVIQPELITRDSSNRI